MKFITSFLILAYVGLSTACGGFKARINFIKNCAGEGQVITVDENSTMIMTPDCKLKASSCVSTIGFGTGMAIYKVSKDGFTLHQGSSDLCETMKEKNDDAVTGSLGLPDSCPFEAGRTCSNPEQEFDIGKLRHSIGMMRGKTIFEVNIEHDVGKTCIKMELEIYK